MNDENSDSGFSANDAVSDAVRGTGASRQELARFLPLWPDEISDLSLRGRRRIVHFLARALRLERRRARQGHWAYDVARHAALARLWRAEAAALQKLEHSQDGTDHKKGPPNHEP